MNAPNLLLLEHIIGNVDIGLIVLDKDIRITIWNDWMVKHSQIKFSNAQNSYLFDLFPSLNHGRIKQGIHNALTYHQHSFITHALKQQLFLLHTSDEKTGEPIPIHQKINISPILVDNQEFVLLEIKDETKFVEKEKILRKRTDDLKIANATKDKFFSIISHDLRSHMSNMLASMEMLHQKNYKLSENKIHFFAESMYKIAKNLFQLIENLLEWASSQSGRMQYNPVDISIDSLIQKYIILFQEMASKKNIEINYVSSFNGMVYGDANMISSIIRNIFSNAIKFTHTEGKVDIILYSEGNHIKIAISDNGIGMSQEEINSLFNVGTAKKSIGTEKEQGTGLGLILCKEFIDYHKGKIEIESKKDAGSTFIVSLPIHHKE